MSLARPRIELICFGSELLKDKINTNVVTVAEKLAAAGLSLSRSVTIADDPRDVERSLRECLRRADVVITSGGLGPTFDDLTRECVSKVTGKPLRFSNALMEKIAGRFKSAGLAMPEENRRQAYVVEGAIPIVNAVGTAPGQIVSVAKKVLAILPGPPKELVPMMDGALVPCLRKKLGSPAVLSAVLHVYGDTESKIDELIDPVVRGDWEQKGVKVVFGILAHGSVIDVKVSVEGRDSSPVSAVFHRIRRELYAILRDKVYGENEDTLESVIGRKLKWRGETLSAAESCTGGLLAGRITSVAGSSDYFKEGVVTYSNESKRRLLGVKAATLKKYGAVSEECAGEMALGVLRKSGSDWGLSVTGIAGPGGGSMEKPVGTVCFGLAYKGGVQTFTKNFYGTRAEVRHKSCLFTLNLLRTQE